MKLLFVLLLLGVGVTVIWFVASLLFRTWWPAEIPPDLHFEHEFATDKKLRSVAEILAKTFKGPTADNVVCCGPVRGNAARVLFHSGPNNKGRGDIHRFDYVLCVERRAGQRVAIVLRTNRPYSSLRIRRREVEPLVQALRESYGGLHVV